LLAKAFEIPPSLVEGFLSSAKGDWASMELMISRVCEYDCETISTIAQLVKRLRRAKEATISISLKEENAQVYHQLRERIINGQNGAEAEQIYNMLDADGSGFIEIEEFSEVMKYYDLDLSLERQFQ
jgi:hypothetical protein